MKKDMTTFEMAQAAYENPGKVFVESGGALVAWNSEVNELLCVVDGRGYPIQKAQAQGYIWNEKVEPRKWSGEYEYVDGRTPPIGHDTPFGGRPKGCAHYRVKWEAEEVL